MINKPKVIDMGMGANVYEDFEKESGIADIAVRTYGSVVSVNNSTQINDVF